MVSRITGLSSGIDYDTIIKQMMDAQRAPVDKLNKQKQLLEWKRDDYRTLNSKILEFKNTAFDMTLQNKYLTKKVSSSNEGAVTVTGTANANNGQYTIQVNDIAQAGAFKSNKLVNQTTGKPLSLNDKLSDMGLTGESAFTIGGEKGTATILMKPTETLNTFISNINGKSASTGVKVSYDATLQTLFFVSSQTGEKSNITLNMSNTADDTGTPVDESMDINKFLGFSSPSSVSTGQTIKSPGEKQFFSKNDVIDGSLIGTKTFSFKFGDETHDYDITSSTKIGDLIDQINDDLLETGTDNKKQGVEAYLSSTGRLMFRSHGTTDTVDFTDTDNAVKDMLGMNGVRFDSSTAVIDKSINGKDKFKIEYDGKTYSYDITSTTTIGQLINNINMDLGQTGVSAYLSKDGKLSFFNPDAAEPLTFGDTAAAVLKKVSLDKPTATEPVQYSSVSSTDPGQTAGKDATVMFNGVEGKYSSNTFSIAGMNITVKQKTAVGEVVQLGVTQDVDAAYDSIKAFVDKYNELIDLVNKELKEQKYRDFQPLTDTEKEGMTEKEIEKWEEKARSGTLANDQLLASGMRELRRALSDPITGLADGQFNSLAAIGISSANVTSGSVSGTYTEQGKLYINESKLKAALADNPESVMALFTTDAVEGSGDGIATRLNDKAQQMFNRITERAGVSNSLEDKYAIGRDTARINEQITSWNRRLQLMEDRYYSQFTRMESYISRMNSQSAYLAQQFSSGG